MDFKKFLSTFSLYNFKLSDDANSKLFTGFNLKDCITDLNRAVKIEENKPIFHNGEEIVRKDGKTWDLNDAIFLVTAHSSCCTSHVYKKKDRNYNDVQLTSGIFRNGSSYYYGIYNIVVKNATFARLSTGILDSIDINLEKSGDDFVLPEVTLENPMIIVPTFGNLILHTDGDIYLDKVHIALENTNLIQKLIHASFVPFSSFGNYTLYFPDLLPIFRENNEMQKMEPFSESSSEKLKIEYETDMKNFQKNWKLIYGGV